MKMSRYFVCCERCFEDIGKENTAAAKLWMDLCALYLQRGQVVFARTLDFPELRTLELLEFVVTTDQPDRLLIRIEGYCKTDDGQDFFCRHGGHHG